MRMRILTVHNKYKFRGGEDAVREDEERLLTEHGHEIENYFGDNQQVNASNLISTGIKAIWSSESYRGIRATLRRQNYDMVNCHNTFPLISPSVYYAAKAEKVAVVQTLHNYRLLCPNSYLFRNSAICENCVGKTFAYPGIVHSCYRDSRAGSTAVAVMLLVHRLIKTYQEKIDVFVALTEFARQKYIEGGLPAEKIVVKPNFVYPDPQIGAGDGNYAIFVGRLSEEKGIATLLEAWETLGAYLPLKIVGDGPLRGKIEQAADTQPGVEYLGAKPSSEIYELIGRASAMIFPSEWYEGLPKVIIEAFAKGTPVISSDVGSMKSLVEHQRNGLHFAPKDVKDLRRQVEWLMENPAKRKQMRREARDEYEAKYTAETNYRMLMNIYRRAVQQSKMSN